MKYYFLYTSVPDAIGDCRVIGIFPEADLEVAKQENAKGGGYTRLYEGEWSGSGRFPERSGMKSL